MLSIHVIVVWDFKNNSMLSKHLNYGIMYKYFFFIICVIAFGYLYHDDLRKQVIVNAIDPIDTESAHI